jgi:hypothetical protein
MSFDLFFTPKKLDFALAMLPGLKLDAKQVKARTRLIGNLCKEFNVQIDSTVQSAAVEGFPAGEMNAHQGYFHWCLHGEQGAETSELIKRVVDWFYAQGSYCIDPQDAGFDNRVAETAVQRLCHHNDLQILIGARLLAVELSGSFDREFLLRWLLSDQREAEIVFIHHVSSAFPSNLTALFDDHLLAANVRHTDAPNNFKALFNEEYCFSFASGREVRCIGTVVRKFTAFVPKKKR